MVPRMCVRAHVEDALLSLISFFGLLLLTLLSLLFVYFARGIFFLLFLLFCQICEKSIGLIWNLARVIEQSPIFSFLRWLMPKKKNLWQSCFLTFGMLKRNDSLLNVLRNKRMLGYYLSFRKEYVSCLQCFKMRRYDRWWRWFWLLQLIQ